jgi:ABC-type transport system substrate-binding protein
MQPLPTPEEPAKPEEAGIQYGGTLKYVYGYSASKNIGWPIDSTNTQAIWGTNFMFAEPLVRMKNDGSVEPWLATSWDIAPDALSVTFHLRQGVRFQDGTDFNADAVKFTLDKVIEAGRAYGTTWDSVEVLDNYTIKLNLTKWENSFWGNIVSTGCMFTSPTAYEKYGEEGIADHPIGTGPFKLVAFERDQFMKFEKNPDYWQEGKPYLDSIQFITVKDRMTQQAALMAGEGDVLALQDAKEMADAKARGFTTVAFAGGTTFLIPDSLNPDSPFTDIRVREAVDYAIDRESLVAAIGYGYKIANTQLPTPVQAAYNPDVKGRNFDLAKAKSLLVEAGYPDGIKTKLYVLDTYKDTALIVQQMLKTANIDAEVEILDNLKFWDMLTNGWSGGLMFAGFGWGPNWASNMKIFFKPTGMFFASLKMPEGSAELMDEALTTTDYDTQVALNRELSKMISDDCTVMCICADALGFIVNPKVKGGHWLEYSDFQGWSPADIWLASD